MKTKNMKNLGNFTWQAKTEATLHLFKLQRYEQGLNINLINIISFTFHLEGGHG
jgi:hypothetical protein